MPNTGYNERISLGNKILSQLQSKVQCRLKLRATRQLYLAVQNTRHTSSSNACKAGWHAMRTRFPPFLSLHDLNDLDMLHTDTKATSNWCSTQLMHRNRTECKEMRISCSLSSPATYYYVPQYFSSRVRHFLPLPCCPYYFAPDQDT